MRPLLTDNWSTDSAPPASGTDPLALASLGTGALSIMTSCCCGCLTLPLAATAIVTGIMVAIKPDANGKVLAYVGIALGGFSLFVMAISMIFGVGANLAEMMQHQ